MVWISTRSTLVLGAPHLRIRSVSRPCYRSVVLVCCLSWQLWRARNCYKKSKKKRLWSPKCRDEGESSHQWPLAKMLHLSSWNFTLNLDYWVIPVFIIRSSDNFHIHTDILYVSAWVTANPESHLNVNVCSCYCSDGSNTWTSHPTDLYFNRPTVWPQAFSVFKRKTIMYQL